MKAGEEFIIINETAAATLEETMYDAIEDAQLPLYQVLGILEIVKMNCIKRTLDGDEALDGEDDDDGELQS